jgi:hypothetical protein
MKIITHKEDSKVPANYIFVEQKKTWLYLCFLDGKWYMNHTNETGNEEWFHKKLIYTAKKQMSLIKLKPEDFAKQNDLLTEAKEFYDKPALPEANIIT